MLLFLKQTAPSGGRSVARREKVELNKRTSSLNLPCHFVMLLHREVIRPNMVHELLAVRLNDREYTNWLKAGRCLLILRDGLQPFITLHMRAFHGDLLKQNTLLRKPCQTSSCRPRGNKLSSACRLCSEWQTVILKHHRQPDVTVNWDNCFPPNWRTDHWELAKAYMPRGQGKVKGADQCDAAALLNLINYCDCFRSVDPKFVREVIRFRNELMHSCEFRVKDEWMRHYQTTVKKLVQQFSHVPQMATVGQQIEEMLTVDLSICVSGLDRMDSADLDGIECDFVSQWETSADLISQWEAELLQERLQELLGAAEDDPKTQKLMEPFIDEEIEKFHGELGNECGPDHCVKECDVACDFKNWKPRPNQSPPLDCDVCSRWRDVILTNHTSQHGKVMWLNSKPHLWSRKKWEVAKVYMPGGHKNHNSVGNFDIAALLCLMNQCKHFKQFELGGLIDKVSKVRNDIMHAPRNQLEQKDLHDYFNRIRELGEVLARHDPKFKNLSEDIDQIQNLNFRLILLDDIEAQKNRAQDEKELEDILFALAAECQLTRMELEKLKTQIAQQEQDKLIPPLDCDVCSRWRDVILTNHTSQHGKVMWLNSKPHLWSRKKWEVAKVYMPGGHKNHNSVGNFDIAALLCLMNQCKHFKQFELGGLIDKVSKVRNDIMHAPRNQLEQKDLHDYFNRIRELGEVLARHDPKFKNLSEVINQIQNLDFRLILLDDIEAQKYRAKDEKELEDILFAIAQRETEHLVTRMELDKLKIQMAQQEQDKLINCYAMIHKPHGLCVIINNEEFLGPSLYNRPGSRQDARALRTVFTRLGFDVVTHNNLTAGAMRRELQQLGSRNFSDDDALVVCVLSHGLKGCVFGTEGQKVYLRELTQPFTSRGAPTLAGKPKLFFIQACQETVYRNGPVSADHSGSMQHPLRPRQEEGDRRGRLEEDEGRVHRESVPCDDDFLLGMATLPESWSFRNPVTGYVYIQELCTQLTRSAESLGKADILDVLTRVNSEVSKGEYLNYKQMPEIRNTLTKKLVLKFV
ncbi:uncharacterized protein LOC119498157 [Sebastes umbrosus]|uniref:uncharacterized protein LOC119498157 n=1 Tax=Sebastes umbrosus TaxID=72105 RepID=UPI00189DAF09|nr:uncharacterized protein LOC119498157 [Sebastes umbrosus]